MSRDSSSYLFKHALVSDAAYGTLLHGRRQELQARVAAALEQDFADLVERQPQLLAHDLTEAGETERAVDQGLEAGRNAAERVAHLEGIRHFDRGLAVLGILPEGPAHDTREIELLLTSGLAHFAAKGFSAPEAAQTMPMRANSQNGRRFMVFGNRRTEPGTSATAADCRIGYSS